MPAARSSTRSSGCTPSSTRSAAAVRPDASVRIVLTPRRWCWPRPAARTRRSPCSATASTAWSPTGSSRPRAPTTGGPAGCWPRTRCSPRWRRRSRAAPLALGVPTAEPVGVAAPAGPGRRDVRRSRPARRTRRRGSVPDLQRRPGTGGTVLHLALPLVAARRRRPRPQRRRPRRHRRVVSSSPHRARGLRRHRGGRCSGGGRRAAGAVRQERSGGPEATDGPKRPGSRSASAPRRRPSCSAPCPMGTRARVPHVGTGVPAGLADRSSAAGARRGTRTSATGDGLQATAARCAVAVQV
jgi:hypothetical protein